MNKLQKSAWFNLGVMAVCVLIAVPCVWYLAHRNARGLDYLIVCLVVGGLTAPFTIRYFKKQEIQLDEREAAINRKAFQFSAIGCALFLAGVCIIPFFVIGGQTRIETYYLPFIFFSTLFTSQLVHSLTIILQCASEDDHG